MKMKVVQRIKTLSYLQIIIKHLLSLINNQVAQITKI